MVIYHDSPIDYGALAWKKMDSLLKRGDYPCFRITDFARFGTIHIKNDREWFING